MAENIWPLKNKLPAGYEFFTNWYFVESVSSMSMSARELG